MAWPSASCPRNADAHRATTERGHAGALAWMGRCVHFSLCAGTRDPPRQVALLNRTDGAQRLSVALHDWTSSGLLRPCKHGCSPGCCSRALRRSRAVHGPSAAVRSHAAVCSGTIGDATAGATPPVRPLSECAPVHWVGVGCRVQSGLSPPGITQHMRLLSCSAKTLRSSPLQLRRPRRLAASALILSGLHRSVRKNRFEDGLNQSGTHSVALSDCSLKCCPAQVPPWQTQWTLSQDRTEAVLHSSVPRQV